MVNKYTFYCYILFSCIIIPVFTSCYKSPTNSTAPGTETHDSSIKVTWEINTAHSSPLRSSNGNIYRETTNDYIYAKKAATILEPPSDVQVSDIPDDNGHFLNISWALSPSEEDGNVDWYRIYRSRSETLTEPVPLSQFTSIDSLNLWDEHYTILIYSVAAGINEYIDIVPITGEIYYYWLQAVGSAEEPSVMGTVTDRDGNPIDGTLLRLYNTDYSVDMYAVSRSDGSYAFYDVPAGEYILYAKRDDYQIFRTTVKVP